MASRYLVGPGFRGWPEDKRKVGDPCPEAEKWRNPKPWLDAGHIMLNPDHKKGKATPTAKVKAVSASEPEPVINEPAPAIESKPKPKRGRVKPKPEE